MIKFLKPFVELGISWKSNEFFRTRVKLTALYISIVSVILIVFSSILHSQVQSSVSDQVNVMVESLKDKENHSHSYEHLGRLFTSDFEHNLWNLNYIIFFLSTFLCYFLAGKTLQPIEEKMKQQEQFISDAAHELRNPLSAIKASSNSLLRMREKLTQESQEAFQEIHEESNRLISLSEDLLTLENNNFDKEISLVEIAETINYICKSLTPLAKEKNLTLVKHLNNHQISANKKDVEKIIFNILHNAIKFSHKNNDIHISLNPKGQFKVKDTGIGISKNDLPYVFNRFYKADKARIFSQHSGSGLGLSIAKKLADHNGWSIALRSKLQQGTEFMIEFN